MRPSAWNSKVDQPQKLTVLGFFNPAFGSLDDADDCLGVGINRQAFGCSEGTDDGGRKDVTHSF
jgi:hypothetical protein